MDILVFAFLFLLLSLDACEGALSKPGIVLDQDDRNAHRSDPSSRSSQIGSPCHSSDPNHFCIGLRFVVYQSNTGVPVLSEQQSLDNIDGINSIWNACNIEFQMDQYLAVDSEAYRLQFNTRDISELDKIRSAFQSDSEFLIVTTGRWNRTGSLGKSTANAWTNMPGQGVYGVVMESSVGTFANIVAHELGHYLSLGHLNDPLDVMNPVIYDSSTALTTNQCLQAQAAVNDFWKKMSR